jgi:hypothetical protein
VPEAAEQVQNDNTFLNQFVVDFVFKKRVGTPRILAESAKELSRTPATWIF